MINYGTGDIVVHWNEVLDQTSSNLVVANVVAKKIGQQYPSRMFLSNNTNEQYLTFGIHPIITHLIEVLLT